MSADLAALLAATQAAEAEQAEVGAEDTCCSVTALAGVLADLASCLLAAISDEPGIAAGCHLEASVATGEAFPFDGPQSRALGVLLDHAAFVMAERQAP